jgi:alpha-methylacyl-CoA racemase
MSLGPIEPQFWAEFARLLPLPADAPGQYDAANKEQLRAMIAAQFKTKTLAEWVEIFEGTDACVAPILTMAEAVDHPHMAARGIFVEADGITQPGPAPRFSRTAATVTNGPRKPGEDTREALLAWGIDDVDRILASGAAAQA